MTELVFYPSGITMATFGLSRLFFLKFWKVSRDRFFAFLASACGLLALERVAGVVTELVLPREAIASGHARSWIYLIRLVAFVMILYAVYGKNRDSSSARSRAP